VILIGTAAEGIRNPHTLSMRAVGCLLPRSAAATFGFRAEWRKLLASRPSLPGRHSIAGRAVPELRTVHSADVTQDPGYSLSERQKSSACAPSSPGARTFG